MTTIAYRGGILAADKQAWLGRGETGHTTKTKIRRLKDGSLIGVSSAIVGAGDVLMDWIDAGGDYADRPVVEMRDLVNDFAILQALPSGTMKVWLDSFQPTVITAEFHAIGSGSSYALGAMARGAFAVEAVGIACQYDNFSGGGIDALAHEQPQ